MHKIIFSLLVLIGASGYLHATNFTSLSFCYSERLRECELLVWQKNVIVIMEALKILDLPKADQEKWEGDCIQKQRRNIFLERQCKTLQELLTLISEELATIAEANQRPVVRPISRPPSRCGTPNLCP